MLSITKCLAVMHLRCRWQHFFFACSIMIFRYSQKKALSSIRLSPSLCLDSISLSENDVPHYSSASKLPRSIHSNNDLYSCEYVYLFLSLANYIFSNTMEKIWKRYIMMRRSDKIWLLYFAFIDFPSSTMTLFLAC